MAIDKLKLCAIEFQKLFNIHYKIILGRKGKETELILTFEKKEFFHLIGLQKLTDLPYLRTNSEKIFDSIMNGTITYDNIRKSNFFQENEKNNMHGIEERIDYFVNIEKIFDSNNLVFKFNNNINKMSKINAEYIFENIDFRKNIYVFIDSRSKDNYKFCRSFFPKNATDYTARQTKMTLLYKEKIDILSKTSIIQLNNIKSKNKSLQLV